MNEQSGHRVRNQRGASILEVLVALMVFAVAVLGLAASGFVASQTLRSSRGYMVVSAVAQSKLDSLTAAGWTALDGQSGSETVQGYPVTWSVQGANPREVTLVVQRQLLGRTMADTFVTYVAE